VHDRLATAIIDNSTRSRLDVRDCDERVERIIRRRESADGHAIGIPSCCLEVANDPTKIQARSVRADSGAANELSVNMVPPPRPSTSSMSSALGLEVVELLGIDRPVIVF